MIYLYAGLCIGLDGIVIMLHFAVVIQLLFIIIFVHQFYFFSYHKVNEPKCEENKDDDCDGDALSPVHMM